MAWPHTAVSRSFNMPCVLIWELLTDTVTWSEWGPSVRDVEFPDRFIYPGAKGRIKTAAGISLPFVITRYEEGKFWSWNVAGIPATGHRVAPQGYGACTLTFEIPILGAPYAYVCKIALDRIDRMLEQKYRG